MGRTSHNTSIVLWTNPKTKEEITAGRCRELLAKDELDALVALCEGRLRERYVDGARKLHVFAVMPLACLLIETIEAYRHGWETTHDTWAPKCIYLPFFQREVGFTGLADKDVVQSFYYDVRCGIVHQGETRNGWALALDASPSDFQAKLINAHAFHADVEKALARYIRELREGGTKGPLWSKFKDKLGASAMHADDPSPSWPKLKPEWDKRECKP